ncbi:MAG: NAD(P)-binding protein [Alphaproteobacteria bacterium]|nr:NAD(P)-binding protein [Alphaproteobacteria bacterium]
MSPRTRVLVLGGGCAGLAAAAELTATPARRGRFEVTVVQQGWRFGGKGTTGRRVDQGHRIEEHGLHVWMGFYRHAFGLMRDVYAEWRPPEGSWLQTLDDAFTPRFRVSLGHRDGRVSALDLPPRPGRPWTDGPDVAWGAELARWAVRELPGLLRQPALRPLAALGAVVVRGLLTDVLRPGGSWENADRYDLMEWLRRHGARDAEVFDGPAVRAFYNLAFAYPDGRSGWGRGSVAAGAAIRSMLRMLLTYRGAPLYEMTAGMGDTVFVPLFEVLRDRGVRLELFHRVDALRVRDGAVDAVDLGVQARWTGAYDPLVEVAGLRTWPERPLEAQLDAIAPGDLEDPDGPVLSTRTLRRGRDFDAVVLAIPVPVLPRIAGEVAAADPAFARMVRAHRSVVTVAAQVWLRPTAEALWSGRSPGVLTNAPGPLSSYADLTDVVRAEAWDQAVGHLAYFVDTHPDGPVDAAALLRAQLDGPMLERWPGARDATGRFDRSLLVHQGDGDPLDAQYTRANVRPWERYVLTPPGSTVHRLPPEHAGIANLRLAGDWTRTSIDGGSVEAAAESGIRAARSVMSMRGGAAPRRSRPPRAR